MKLHKPDSPLCGECKRTLLEGVAMGQHDEKFCKDCLVSALNLLGFTTGVAPTKPKTELDDDLFDDVFAPKLPEAPQLTKLTSTRTLVPGALTRKEALDMIRSHTKWPLSRVAKETGYSETHLKNIAYDNEPIPLASPKSIRLFDLAEMAKLGVPVKDMKPVPYIAMLNKLYESTKNWNELAKVFEKRLGLVVRAGTLPSMSTNNTFGQYEVVCAILLLYEDLMREK